MRSFVARTEDKTLAPHATQHKAIFIVTSAVRLDGKLLVLICLHIVKLGFQTVITSFTAA